MKMRCPLARSMRFWRKANNIEFIILNPDDECKSDHAYPSKMNTAMVQHLSSKVNIYHRIMLKYIELMSKSADVLDGPKKPTQVKPESQVKSNEELSLDTTVLMNNTTTGTVAKSVYSTEETTNSPTKDSNSGGEDTSSDSKVRNLIPSDTIVSNIITSPVILDIKDSKNDDTPKDDG